MQAVRRFCATSLCIVLCLAIVKPVMGQCAVNKTQRPDGKTAYQAPQYISGPLAGNENLQLVLFPMVIGEDYSVAGFVRWRNNSRVVSGSLRIILQDGNTLLLNPSSQREMRTGGSNVTSIVYKANENQLVKMLESDIKTLNLQVDGSWNVFSATDRRTEFTSSLECLQSKTGIPLK